MAAALEPRQLALEADRSDSGLPRPEPARPGRAAARDLPAAGVRGRGARAQVEARPGRRRRGLSVAGRRLRRELLGASRRRHPRFLPGVPADGDRADLCRRLAGGEGRAYRRSVRQAALVADRDARRQGAAELSRRHHQRHRVHRGGARARPAASADGLSAGGRHAQSAQGLRPRRLRQSRACASLESRLRQGQPGRPPLRGAVAAHRRDLALHARLRAQRRQHAAASHHELLHQPRGAAARLRAGDDARRFHVGRLVRDLGAYVVGRRPHPPARSCPYRISARHQEPGRRQDRAEPRAGSDCSR